MYLYLGQDTVIHEEELLGIFDLDNTTVSIITREYLNNAQKAGKIITVSQELPKSFVVRKGKTGSMIYLSQVSPATLRKRAQDHKVLVD